MAYFIKREYHYYVYMMASKNNRALYIGITNTLQRRVKEHKEGKHEGFTKKYKCVKLVHFEETSDVNEAIVREKQLKKWSRKKKEDLINRDNPNWDDLSKDWF